MNYDTMPAGPELDRLVAEKVMGWDPDNQANNSEFNPQWFDSRHGFWWIGEWGEEGTYSWSPSAIIAHAWEVVERMRGQGLWFQLTAPHPGSIDPQWRCSFGGVYLGIGDTAPLAICRAALKAVAG